MKIKVNYIDEKDNYSKLYELSKKELIEIIKQDDKLLDQLGH